MAEILQYRLDVDKRSLWQIVTVHSAVKSGLIYTQEVGDFLSGPDYYTVREGLDSFLIKLTLSGGGVLEYEGTSRRISAGQFFWIDCQKPQRYYTDPDHGRWHMLWVHFRGGNAKTYYELFRTMGDGSPVGTMPAHCDGEGLLKQLISCYSENNSAIDNDIAASSVLTQLISCCVRAAAVQEENGAVPDVVRKIYSYLLEHYAENIRLETLSQQFSVSKYHLQRIFKRYVGQSPLEFLSGVRLTQAKQLLRTTDLPVSEIAYRVGIENDSYFIRKFRAEEEMTPHQYRKYWSNGRTENLQHPES